MNAIFPVALVMAFAFTWAMPAQAADKARLPPAKTEIEPSSKAKEAVRSSGVKKTIGANKDHAGSGVQSAPNKPIKVRGEAADQKLPQPVSAEGLKDHPATKNKE